MKIEFRRTTGWRWLDLFWEQVSGEKAHKTIVKPKKKKEVKHVIHHHVFYGRKNDKKAK